jgi:hypothetical protein
MMNSTVWKAQDFIPWHILMYSEFAAKSLWDLTMTVWAISWYYILGLCIGYGYFPWGAFVPSIVIILFWSISLPEIH